MLLESVRSRSLGYFLRWIALAFVAIALAQFSFVAVVYLSTGMVVDYGPYLDLISQYRPSEDSPWSVPFVPDYALWLPIALAYFLVMAGAVHRSLCAAVPDSIVERLLPVAVLGLGPLTYFFGRPQEGTLNIACLSFAVVAIGIAESIFMKARRFGPVGPVLSKVMAVAFAFTIADGFEHFMRPSDASLGNATILRRCFTDEGCRLADVPRNIDLALRTQPLDPRTKVGYFVGGPRDGRARIEEAISMLRRLAPDAPYVGMLTDFYPQRYADSDMAVGATAFMATGQWYAWSISSPVNDGLSPIVTKQILRRVAETPAGMLIIISNRRDGWAPINQLILEGLSARCRLLLVEAGKYHSAVLTDDCTG